MLQECYTIIANEHWYWALITNVFCCAGHPTIKFHYLYLLGVFITGVFRNSFI